MTLYHFLMFFCLCNPAFASLVPGHVLFIQVVAQLIPLTNQVIPIIRKLVQGTDQLIQESVDRSDDWPMNTWSVLEVTLLAIQLHLRVSGCYRDFSKRQVWEHDLAYLGIMAFWISIASLIVRDFNFSTNNNSFILYIWHFRALAYFFYIICRICFYEMPLIIFQVLCIHRIYCFHYFFSHLVFFESNASIYISSPPSIHLKFYLLHHLKLL